MLIVTWNSMPELTDALGALTDPATPPYEVICVDNASVDDSAVQAQQAGATVIVNDRNEGFPAAVNKALAAATGDAVLLLNPDVRVELGCVARCLEVLESDPGIGLVTANLSRPGGEPDWPAARRFRTLRDIAAETFGLTHLSTRLDRQYLSARDRTVDRDVPCANGAFLLMRRAELLSMGGLDESVFMYLEDQDLCWRLHQAGRRIRFVSDARAIHVAAAATSRATDEQRATAWLHLIDADVELVRRREGRRAARAALVLYAARSTAGLLVASLRRDSRRQLRYRRALAWVVQQGRGRRPPPPVPAGP